MEPVNDPEAILNRKFWLIILESFTLEEVNNLDGYAQSVEDCVRWGSSQ